MRCRNGGIIRAVLLAAGLWIGPAAAQPNEQQLPDGPMKEKMVKLCVGCHEIELVVARRHTRTEWEGVMEDMVARGSNGTAEDLAALVEYLNRNLGKVNVNQATTKDLQAALKLEEKDAQAIVSWREQHGKFKNFEEVRKTPGLDAAKLADKRGWMAFE